MHSEFEFLGFSADLKECKVINEVIDKNNSKYT
jgi:hypothetical protein